MAKKKVTIQEWNKEFFNSWTKIKKITPHFTEWVSGDDGEESPERTWNEIEKIDIEFDDGSKISIIPKSNRDDANLEDDEDNPLCLALDIVQFKPETVNWRIPKN